MQATKQLAKDLGAAFKHAVHDNCFILAKAVSYSAVLSLFPGLIVVTNLLLWNHAQRTIDDLAVAIGAVLPPRVTNLLADYLTVSDEQSAVVLALAALAATLFAADMVYSLMEGFRTAYRAPRRSLWREYAVAIELVFLSVIPLSIANAGLILSRQIGEWVDRLGFVDPVWLGLAVQIAWWAVALPTVTLILGLMYHIAPNRRQTWKGVFPGALLAACLWAPATGLFTLYVQRVRYREFYGSVSTVIVLLIWTYLSSVIVLLGCEYNAIRERRSAQAATEA